MSDLTSKSADPFQTSVRPANRAYPSERTCASSRFLDRSARIGTTDRRHPRPTHPPLPDHRDQGRELSAPRRQDAYSPSEVRRRAQRNITGARCQFQARGRRKDQPLACCHRAVVFDRRAPVSYTHLRAHETVLDLVCRLLLEKKKK